MSENNANAYVIKSSKISTDLLIHILLSVFLGCFWLWPWVYKTTALLNDVKGLEYRKPSSKLALFILIPFYSVYWFGQTAKGVEFAEKQAKKSVSFAGICTFLAFVAPCVASILIQMEIEKLTSSELFIPHAKGKNEKAKAEPKSFTPAKSGKENVPPKAIATNNQAAVTSLPKEKEPELLCPNCKENLYFMGWDPGEKAQCPFCDKEFVV